MTKNQVEDFLQKGQNVVVVEDLISTGGSSLLAVDALRNEGANVKGMAAILLTFPISKEKIETIRVSKERKFNSKSQFDKKIYFRKTRYSTILEC